MPDLQSYLPDYYLAVLDFVELIQTEEVELQFVKDAINQLLDDQFVSTSSVAMIKRREQMLGIRADPATETLDFRRKRIINRYSTKPPFTLRYLQARLDFLLGPGKALVSVEVQAFLLRVATALPDAPLFREMERTIKTVLPANIIYQQETAVFDGLSLQEYISMRPLVRQARLSTSWRLGVTPFATHDPEVIIK